MVKPLATNNALSQKDQDRLKTLWFFIGVSVVTCPGFVYMYWKLELYAIAWMVLAAVPMALFSYVIWRVTGSITLAGNWNVANGFFLFLTVSLFMGGLQAPTIIWCTIVPIMATLICGQISGIFWFILALAEVIFFYWLMITGTHIVKQIPDQAKLDLVRFVNVMGAVSFSFSLAAIAEFFKNNYFRKIQEKNDELQVALDNIRTLKGLVPICAWCKKIRNDKGYWDQMEIYVSANTEAEFSHGICPECSAKQLKDLEKTP